MPRGRTWSLAHVCRSPRASERSNGAAASAAWDIEGVRGAVRLHDGFTAPAQCVKALLGSHADLSSGGEVRAPRIVDPPSTCLSQFHQGRRCS